MPRSTPVRRRGPNGRFLSTSTNATQAILPPQAKTFLTLPVEVRCAVYKALFNGTDKPILRRQTESKARNAPYITPFHNTIIRTCKTICIEALPIFYSTQKFHYSAKLDEVPYNSLFLPEHTKWIKHLSIEVTVNSQTSAKLDSTVAAHVQMIIKNFTTLASFTLHVIPAIETREHSPSSASGLFDPGAAVKALKSMRSKIVLLRIVMFGNWHDLHPFRSAIAAEEKWVQGDKCWGSPGLWPGLRLTTAQNAAMRVRQRRYTLVGRLNEIHPHKQCIRIFDLYQPRIKR